MSHVTTVPTDETLLRTSIPSVGVPTIATYLRRVGRVNKDKGNAPQFRFVLKVLAQTIKRPVVMSGALLLTNSPCPFVDAFEIFDGDAPTGAFSIGDNALGYLVIHITLKSIFSPTQFLQSPLGTIGSNSLKLGLAPGVPLPLVLCMFVVPKLPIARNGNISHSHVHSDEIGDGAFWLFWYITSDVQIEFPVAVNQCGTVGVAAHQPLVMVIALPAYPLQAAADAGNSDGIISEKRPQSGIEFNAIAPLESPLFPIPSVCFASFKLGISLAFVLVHYLVRLTHSSNGTNDMVGTKARELEANFLIAPMVQVVLPVDILCPSNMADAVAGRVVIGHCLQQCICLFSTGIEFDTSYDIHYDSIVRSKREVNRFSFPTRDRGF